MPQTSLAWALVTLATGHGERVQSIASKPSRVPFANTLAAVHFATEAAVDIGLWRNRLGPPVPQMLLAGAFAAPATEYGVGVQLITSRGSRVHERKPVCTPGRGLANSAHRRRLNLRRHWSCQPPRTERARRRARPRAQECTMLTRCWWHVRGKCH